MKAPRGYKYAIIIYRLKNDDQKAVDIAENNWTFVTDDFSYRSDAATYIFEQHTDIYNKKHGTDIEHYIVFMIPDKVTSGTLKYDPLRKGNKVTLYHDESLHVESELQIPPSPPLNRLFSWLRGNKQK
ncbi:MAG: hypothetical protein ACT6FF_04140 [Methanosarcinaceae archaeon]